MGEHTTVWWSGRQPIHCHCFCMAYAERKGLVLTFFLSLKISIRGNPLIFTAFKVARI